MSTYFTADLHHGSKNIIGYCNRPFSSVEEMDEALIYNWNSTVSNKDTIYILGDVVWGHKNYKDVFSKLNGQKHLILGNHDTKDSYKKLQTEGIIQSISKIKSIKIDNKQIILCHFPMRSWDGSFHGSYHLFGHCHGTIEDFGFSTDVGVDRWNYTPVSYEQIVEHFKDRDKLYNLEKVRNYNLYKNNFINHFTNKYLDRVNSETEELEKLLGN